MPTVDPNAVILTGENPFIRLSATDGGPNTTEARKRIVADYINSVPLGAIEEFVKMLRGFKVPPGPGVK